MSKSWTKNGYLKAENSKAAGCKIWESLYLNHAIATNLWENIS